MGSSVEEASIELETSTHSITSMPLVVFSSSVFPPETGVYGLASAIIMNDSAHNASMVFTQPMYLDTSGMSDRSTESLPNFSRARFLLRQASAYNSPDTGTSISRYSRCGFAKLIITGFKNYHGIARNRVFLIMTSKAISPNASHAQSM